MVDLVVGPPGWCGEQRIDPFEVEDLQLQSTRPDDGHGKRPARTAAVVGHRRIADVRFRRASCT
jgi:hypothetical protein